MTPVPSKVPCRALTTALMILEASKLFGNICFSARHFLKMSASIQCASHAVDAVMLTLAPLLPLLCAVFCWTHRYLRGKIQTLPGDNAGGSHVPCQRVREAHFELYRQTRKNALALWSETVGIQGHLKRACGTGITSVGLLFERVIAFSYSTSCVVGCSLVCAAGKFTFHVVCNTTRKSEQGTDISIIHLSACDFRGTMVVCVNVLRC